MTTIIVLVLLGFFVSSLVVPLFVEDGVSDSIFGDDARGASWGRASLPATHDLQR